MKKTLLIGLAAVALGSMTACSNILEEEGVISAQTGTLTIGLEQDNTVNVVTKTVEAAPDGYIVNLTNGGNNYISNKTYSEVKNKSYSLPANANYVLESYNQDPSTMKDIEWDNPFYYGKKEDINVVGGTTTNVELTCTLKNSQITIDKESLETDAAKKLITVTSIKLKNGEKYSSIFGDDVTDKTLNSNILYVKDGIPAELELIITRKDDNNKITTIRTPLVSNSNQVLNTESAKNYKVKYELSTEYGVAKIVINIDNTITMVDLGTITVNPYDSNNN